MRSPTLLIAFVVAVGYFGPSSGAHEVTSTIAFTSTRGNPPTDPRILGGEIYLIDHHADGSFSVPRRVTHNEFGDTFPALSPDGRGRIVFDSTRRRADNEPVNQSDLFIMNHDGTEQTFLTRGGSPSWRRASKMIAFHASASGMGLPINPFPGSATVDSDIFSVDVEDLLENGALPLNLTSNRVLTVDDDPNWSPNGRKIAFTSYVPDLTTTLTPAEIYMMNADGTGQEQLTNDGIEKRGPAFSPNGRHILFACRMGPINANGVATFEICVMDAVANGAITRLTVNGVNDLTPNWSPDGSAIVSHRAPANQLWVMNADGSDQTQLTGLPGSADGLNLLATSWGVIAESARVSPRD